MQQILLILPLAVAGLLLQTAQAQVVELQSYNFPDHYIGHYGSEAYITRQTQPSQWNQVQGLCGHPGTVSLQLSHTQNVYLRHRDFLLYADPFHESALFRNDACFYVRENQWFPGHDAFESVNYPGRFIRHQGYRLKLHPYESAALFEKDASFRKLQPICYRIQSQNYPAYYFGLNGNEAFIKQYSNDRFVLVSPGLAGHAQSVSFRSCSDATKYLRHRDYLLYEDSYSSTVLYKLDATFTVREDKWFNGYEAVESVNFPQHFIRHQGFRLKISAYDNTQIYKHDASFRAVQ